MAVEFLHKISLLLGNKIPFLKVGLSQLRDKLIVLCVNNIGLDMIITLDDHPGKVIFESCKHFKDSIFNDF